MVGKYLITTDAFFFAPDGKQYRAAWGEVLILPDSVLGVKTNEKSSNWYVRVGSEQEHVIIAGCQIHYAVKVDQCPNLQDVQERVGTDNTLQTLDSRIYVPVRSEIPQPPCILPAETDGLILDDIVDLFADINRIRQMLDVIYANMHKTPENISDFNILRDRLDLRNISHYSRIKHSKKGVDTQDVDIYDHTGKIYRSYSFLCKC